MMPHNLTMIPVRENSEVVMKFTQILEVIDLTFEGLQSCIVDFPIKNGDFP